MEKEKVTTRKISCSGGSGSLGHPLVYLNMGTKDSVTCPYCGKIFELSNSAKTSQ